MMSAFTEDERRQLARYASWLARSLPDLTNDPQLLAAGRELQSRLAPAALAQATLEDRRELARRAAAVRVALDDQRDRRWESWTALELNLLSPDWP